jgi:DNA repair protein RecN (Recombination protein N)
VLRDLHITALGVIDDLELSFGPGVNVLTGETGAGKTMITVGLSLVIGRRASATLVRPGARGAMVQARFDPTPGAEAGGWAEDGEVIVSRTIAPDGRSTARIAGQMAPVSTLADVGAGLVEFHGQQEDVLLRSHAAQTAFLDRFAGASHVRALQAFEASFDRLLTAERRLAELSARERERARLADVLAHQVRELETAGLRPGQLAELESDESRLAHAERLLERAHAAEEAIAADDAAGDRMRSAAAALAAIADLDPAAMPLAERVRAVAEEAVEAAHDVRAYRESVELDPARLEATRERIAAVRSVLRKYGDTEKEALAFLERTRRELADLEDSDREEGVLERHVASLRAQVRAALGAVSATRAEAAPRLASAIERELGELGLEGARIEIALAPYGQPTRSGAEHASFMFAGGHGQPTMPLSKVASGGELSRTMLACRTVLVDLDDVPTLVFDEVDAGIGGRAAVAVGRRLAELGRRRQVLVVTHLPQIAAFADRQIVVEKRDGSATARVVDGGERVAELSRMLSGLPQSEAAALHAEELLAEAARSRTPV